MNTPFKHMTTKQTIKRHTKLLKYIEKQLGNDEDITMLGELLELERELTLKEEQPY